MNKSLVDNFIRLNSTSAKLDLTGTLQIVQLNVDIKVTIICQVMEDLFESHLSIKIQIWFASHLSTSLFPTSTFDGPLALVSYIFHFPPSIISSAVPSILLKTNIRLNQYM
jgi:hypothetical protein